MLLQRCIEPVRRCVPLLTLMVLSGCAGGNLATVPTAVDSGTSTQAAATDSALVPAAALALYEQATAIMAAGDFVEAELRFKGFLLQYPEYPGAHVNLAIIETMRHNDEAARVSLDAALAINPEYPAALNQLGQLLRRNGDFSGAEATYLKAVTVSPDYALAHYNLGVLYELYLQRLDDALTHFEAYQALVAEDKQVEKWIADLRRRIAATQRTANMAD
jgi:tetratricopeptide (TPR) repeat protein